MLPTGTNRLKRRTRRIAWIAAVLFLIGSIESRSIAQQIRPGVWAGTQLQALPLPNDGFQVYFVGELHGIQQNAEFQVQYLAQLNKTAHLRDLAIEEKSVYEDRAQTYIDGKSSDLPAQLCLRTSLLRAIRQLNASLKQDERIRIHLLDIDSPPGTIREHLVNIQSRTPAASKVDIPEADKIGQDGLASVMHLRQFPLDQRSQSELRTVEHSIRAYQLGFEAGTGPAKGSPYLEDREQAMTDNLLDIIRSSPARSVLVLCGADHASRAVLKDGGPDRNQPFAPMALRLQRSGIKIYSVATFPLAGSSFWRGSHRDLLWQPADGHLASGETMDKLLAAAPQAKFFYIDKSQESARLPSQDISNFIVDAFLLFPSASAMKDECSSTISNKKAAQ
jgi:hypothetical protein